MQLWLNMLNNGSMMLYLRSPSVLRTLFFSMRIITVWRAQALCSATAPAIDHVSLEVDAEMVILHKCLSGGAFH